MCTFLSQFLSIRATKRQKLFSCEKKNCILSTFKLMCRLIDSILHANAREYRKYLNNKVCSNDIILHGIITTNQLGALKHQIQHKQYN